MGKRIIRTPQRYQDGVQSTPQTKNSRGSVRRSLRLTPSRKVTQDVASRGSKSKIETRITADTDTTSEERNPQNR